MMPQLKETTLWTCGADDDGGGGRRRVLGGVLE